MVSVSGTLVKRLEMSKGTEEDRGGKKGKVSDFFYKGKRIRHALDRQVLKDWLEKTGKPFSQLMLGRSCH